MPSLSSSPNDPSAGKTYVYVDPSKISHVEIFPPIGIARVGDSGALCNGQPDPNSEIEYFYGPEVPGLEDHPFRPFRDGNNRIKRQAARFRVYAYDALGNILGEINNAQDYRLTWTVHVANKKAAFYLCHGRFSAEKQTLRNPGVDPVQVHVPAKDPTPEDRAFDPSLQSREKLIIDPGVKTIVRNGTDPEPVPLDGKFQGSAAEPITVNLGKLCTDSLGRLVFLPGSGHARSVHTGISFQKQPDIVSEFDSVDWYDNTCDGWVSVSVYHPSRGRDPFAQLKSVHKATVICGPPNFAWGIESPTSLYDIIEDMYKKHYPQYEEHSGTDFFKDIWPILSGTYKLSWVNEKAFQGHGPGGFGNFLMLRDNLSSKDPQHKPLRDHIFGRLRQPDYENKDQAHVILMPRLSGDDGRIIEPGTIPTPEGMSIRRFSALTALQYERFRKWKDGDFNIGTPFGAKKSIEEYDPEEQPAVLTRAALEHTIGDPLYPGIETYWIVKCPETFSMHKHGIVKCPLALHPPFRVDHDKVLPGFLSRGLSLPWQSDFSQCKTHWWPSARPDDIVLPPEISSKDEESLAKWLSTVDLTTLPRRKWTEGLRDNPDDPSTAFFPGSTDMVHQWNNLGFVSKFEHDLVRNKPPVWFEVERNRIQTELHR